MWSQQSTQHWVSALLMMSVTQHLHAATRNSLIDIQHLIMTMIACTSGESWTHLRCVWSMVMILISHQISWLLLPSHPAGYLIETGRRSSQPSSCLVSPACTSSRHQIISFSPRPQHRISVKCHLFSRDWDSNLIIKCKKFQRLPFNHIDVKIQV